MNGIDVSNYQSTNYKLLIDKYGKDFVIARACWRYNVDASCDKIIQYTKSKGKKYGFYFFPLPSDGSASKHAEWSVKQVEGYKNEGIPLLDWETYSGSEGRLDVSNTTWALEWLKTYEKLTGVKPMIYMNLSCLKSNNFQAIRNNNNGLWLAYYGDNTGKMYSLPSSIPYWGKPAIYQYTSRLGGENCDGDYFYGDNEAWDKFAGKEIQKYVQASTKEYLEQAKTNIDKAMQNL